MEEIYTYDATLANMILEKIYDNNNNIIILLEDINKFNNFEEISKLLQRYYIDSTKIYKNFSSLISYQEISDFKNKINYDENIYDQHIKYFLDNNIIRIIDPSEFGYNVLGNKKLFLTPIGVIFYCEIHSLVINEITDYDFNDILYKVIYIIGMNYNDLIINRIITSISQVGGNLNEKEIIFTLFLIISQNIELKRALIIPKPVPNELTIPLNKLSSIIFNKENFNIDIDDWIRRTTQSGGLKAKLLNKFEKIDAEEGTYYKIYLNLAENEINDIVKKVISDYRTLTEINNTEIFINLIKNYTDDCKIIYGERLDLLYMYNKVRSSTQYLIRLERLFSETL